MASAWCRRSTPPPCTSSPAGSISISTSMQPMSGFTPCNGAVTGTFNCNKNFGKSSDTSWEGLDIFQVGGVIFF